MDETIALIRQSQQGDKAARDHLVQSNLGLVWSIVRRFDNRGQEMEDLFQIGSIGLLKAIDKFDLSFSVRFSTYAVPLITGEIKRFLRDDGMIKISRSLKENAAKIRAAESALQTREGREPTLLELTEATGIPQEEIVMALEANYEVESIYKPLGQSEGNEVCLVDRLPEQDRPDERLLDHMLLEQLLEKLEGMERELIFQRYFQEKTQTQVAQSLGITQVQVSRLEKKILLRLRKEAGGV
ncbi:MAG: SigB/SigF/SigG family RNA polymerase sigma factor [Lachnospiraceae bacterium]|nr:SigB/SigF/SigG family RNA polymerase sigma factor [Lachnospiraceae bacterium]MCI9151345.1 SigB/SigF/SigG family RNA polymerase sigma factor [Lachnospiraceae bacterium]